jgi:hypothetical protein
LLLVKLVGLDEQTGPPVVDCSAADLVAPHDTANGLFLEKKFGEINPLTWPTLNKEFC